MRVGVFLPGYTPEVGGGHTFTAEVFESLIELAEHSRHKFVVFWSGRQPEILHGGRGPRGLRVVNLPPAVPRKRAVARLQQLARLGRTVRTRSPLAGAAAKAGVEFMCFFGPGAEPLDVPYLTVVWDLQHRLQPWFPEVSAAGIWEAREASHATILRRASVIIAGTKVGQGEIEHLYQIPAARIRLLPHPTPRMALDPSSVGGGRDVLLKYNLREGYLFYPAQFWAHKNHAGLLLAVHRLREQYQIDLQVVFVGSEQGNQSYVKRLAAQLGLSARVRFLGFVEREDIVALYRGALALTYMTFFGPENLPPLEAFGLGCPVVASDVPGAREQLGDAAVLVDPRSPEDIAIAIKSVAEDAVLRQTLIQRGFERAARWTASDFAKGLFSILDEFEPVRRCWE